MRPDRHFESRAYTTSTLKSPTAPLGHHRSKSDSKMSTAYDEKVEKVIDVRPSESISTVDGVPPLGVPGEERRFWWQRTKASNADAIATQVSVPRAKFHIFGLRLILPLAKRVR
jgi:hypothetical protein